LPPKLSLFVVFFVFVVASLSVVKLPKLLGRPCSSFLHKILLLPFSISTPPSVLCSIASHSVDMEAVAGLQQLSDPPGTLFFQGSISEAIVRAQADNLVLVVFVTGRVSVFVAKVDEIMNDGVTD
jgi:hypothetical protein